MCVWLSLVPYVTKLHTTMMFALVSQTQNFCNYHLFIIYITLMIIFNNWLMLWHCQRFIILLWLFIHMNYLCRPKMVVLGSREQLCIHPDVSLLHGKTQTNACHFLCQKRTKRYCAHFPRVSGISKLDAVVSSKIHVSIIFSFLYLANIFLLLLGGQCSFQCRLSDVIK